MYERFTVTATYQGTSLFTTIARTPHTKEPSLLIHNPHDVIFLKVADHLRHTYEQQAGGCRG